MPANSKAAGLAAHVVNLLAESIGFKVAGPAGAGAAYSARIGQRVLDGGMSAARAGRMFEGGAPRVPVPPPGYAVPLGFGVGRATALGAPGLMSELVGR